MFRTSRFEVDDQTFALGFATNSPYNLQGFHSPNLLAVITEAHAVDKDDIDAIRRLNPSRLLMMGNPLVGAGEFYDSHHIRRELYETVQISALDTPNVMEDRVVIPGMITQQDIADRRAEWGEKSPLYVAAVLAEFPSNLDTVVVPLSAATEAARRELAPEGPVVLGCDVARYGHDKTVVMRREGSVARIVWRVTGRDTMQIAGFLKAYCDSHEVDTVVVDDTGIDISSELTVTHPNTADFNGKGTLVRVAFGATAGYLTLLKLRTLNAFTYDAPVLLLAEHATSKSTYGERIKTIDARWTREVDVALATIQSRRDRRKDPKTVLRVVVPNGSKANIMLILQRGFSDRVTVDYGAMGIDETFFIEGHRTTVSEGWTMVTRELLLQGV